MDGDGSVAPVDARVVSPYVGLSFYTEADAEWFFGREDESQTIIANLRAARLTILYAQSGVGKSSLLRAGVARELGRLAQRQLAQRGRARYVPVVFSDWKDDPVDDLIGVIQGALAPDLGGRPTAQLPRDGLDAAIEAASEAAGGRLLIILDQFEEYFLYRTREDSERRFVDELARCVNRSDLRANFLIAIREDAYAGLGDLFAGKIANVYGNYLQLEYLDRDAARESIVGPIEHFNGQHPGEPPITIEPALVEAVLDQVRTGEVVLGQPSQGAIQAGNGASGRKEEIETPYLQLVMTTLWNHERERESRVLRLSTLRELGGAQEIVRTHLDGALTALPDEARDAALDLFRYLVTPSGTKIVYAASDLAQMTERPEGQVADLLAQLAQGDTRIVRHVPPPPGRAAPDDRYEIFHDVLAPAIIDWRRRALEQRKTAEEAREREQLEAEKRAAEQLARRERRRVRALAALAVGLLALVVIAAVAVVFAEREKNRADVEQRTDQSRQLAAQAVSRFNDDPDEATLLSLEAYRITPTPDARGAMLSALQKNQPTLVGNSGFVEALAASPVSDDTLASVSYDGTLRLWSVANHQQIGDSITWASGLASVAFSPDGRTVAAGTTDGHVLLVPVPVPSNLDVLNPPNFKATVGTEEVSGVAFSPHGTLLATASYDRTVRLWSVPSGREVGAPVTLPGLVTSVAFSPDGKTVAAGVANGSVELLSAATLKPLGAPITAHTSEVSSVAFSPGGQLLAAGSWDGTVSLTSLATHRTTARLPTGDDSFVNSVAFSPNGRTLAVSGYDGALRLWSVATGALLGMRLANSGEGVAFTAGGRTVASGNSDAINLWNVGSGIQVARPVSALSSGTAMAVSSDGQEVATTSALGNSILVFDARAGREIGAPTHPLDATIYRLAFSPDGKTIASDSLPDRTIRLWSVSTGLQVGTPFSGQTDIHEPLAFSPNGQLIAAALPNDAIGLWSTSTHNLSGPPLVGHTGLVATLAFSPDGQTLASGGQDQSVRLWNVETRKPIATLLGHTAVVQALAFSPDGSTLASGARDGTVLFWSVADHRQIGSPLLASSGVNGLTFSGDGKTLATVSANHNLQLWDVASGEALGAAWDFPGPPTAPGYLAVGRLAGNQLVTATGALGPASVLIWSPLLLSTQLDAFTAALCPTVTHNLTEAEWNQALPNEPYHATCPGKAP